jgi:hypothetical protein
MEGSYKSNSNKKSGNNNKFDNKYRDDEKKITYTCPNHADVNKVGIKNLHTYCPKCRTQLVEKDSLIYNKTISKAMTS